MPELGPQDAGIGVEDAGIEDARIRVKAMDSEVTANPGLQTAFTVLPTNHHRPTEVVVVGGLDERATIDEITRKIKNYFAIKFETEVLIEDLDDIVELVGLHGEKVLEA